MLINKAALKKVKGVVVIPIVLMIAAYFSGSHLKHGHISVNLARYDMRYRCIDPSLNFLHSNDYNR